MAWLTRCGTEFAYDLYVKKGELDLSSLSWDFTSGRWSGRLDSNQRPPAPKARWGELSKC